MVKWDSISLEDACVPKGVVRGPFGGSLTKNIFVATGYKVYEQRNAIYKSTKLGSYYITDEKYREMSRFAILPGDFIVSCSGTIGKIYRIPQNAPKGVINQALLKLTIDEKKVDPTFFEKYFEWELFQKSIIDDTQGGAMKNLVGMDIFKKTLLAYPLLPEQTAIAEALSDADRLISSLEKLIAKKKAIKQGAMQELLTGKKRLPGFIGEWGEFNLVANSKLKARIGWQGLTTAEYLSQGDYILITGTDFANGKIEWSTCSYVEKKRYAQDPHIQIKNSDVLITKDGTIGKVAFVERLPKPATLNSGVFVVRPLVKGSYSSRFVYHILNSSIFVDFLSKLSAGSTINHLYQKDIGGFSFSAPPTVEEQSAIAAILSDMDAEIEQFEKKLSKYRLIKQGMMQELLTGRIRLVDKKRGAR